jgi:hypothetical protein
VGHANGEDKEHDLEFKALGGDGMNAFRQQALDKAAGGFDDFAARACR